MFHLRSNVPECKSCPIEMHTCTSRRSDTVLSCSKEQEISWTKLIMAQCCCTYSTQPARKSHWSCRNILSHTQTRQYTHKHALTHMHRSFHSIAQCLHYQVRRSHVFAGTQGPVTHRRYMYMAVLFALCICVCVEGSASNACRHIPLFVCASVWIGVYLSGINHTRASPDSHITGIGFLLVPFPITE